MMRRGVLLGLLLLGTSAGHGLAQTVPTAPGGGAYFGRPQNDPFTPAQAFAPPSVSPLPVRPAIGAGADGGLLPLPEEPPPPPLWSGSFEAGLNGATGNAELFNMRVGWHAERKALANIFVTDFLYTYTNQNSLTTVQQAIYNARDEVLFPHTPWTLFGATQVEYDELRAYKFRIGVYAGTGYTVVNDEFLTFRLRGGAGAVYEIGSGDLEDRWVPELVFGYDLRYKMNDRSSFVSIFDYYPRVDDFGQFRIRARVAYEYILDPESCMILRIGAQDRYDSNPGNAKRNDLTYFSTLGFKF